MRKRLLLGMLALTLVFSTSACGGNAVSLSDNDADDTTMADISGDESDTEQEVIINSKDILSEEEYEWRDSRHEMLSSELDKTWGIKTFDPSNDTKLAAAYEIGEATYQAFLEVQAQLNRQEVVDAEAALNAAYQAKWDDLNDFLYDLTYSAIYAYVDGYDASAATGDTNCSHNWKEARYHKKGNNVTTTEKVDGYVVDEQTDCYCSLYMCYECSKCGAVKSYISGSKGEYTLINGSVYCTEHKNEATGEMIKVN